MTSICWNCKNGRADRCDWIDKKEKVWEKAREEIRGRNWAPLRCGLCRNASAMIRKIHTGDNPKNPAGRKRKPPAGHTHRRMTRCCWNCESRECPVV